MKRGCSGGQSWKDEEGVPGGAELKDGARGAELEGEVGPGAREEREGGGRMRLMGPRGSQERSMALTLGQAASSHHQ